MKMKKFWAREGGARPWSPPLDPPLKELPNFNKVASSLTTSPEREGEREASALCCGDRFFNLLFAGGTFIITEQSTSTVYRPHCTS